MPGSGWDPEDCAGCKKCGLSHDELQRTGGGLNRLKAKDWTSDLNEE